MLSLCQPICSLLLQTNQPDGCRAPGGRLIRWLIDESQQRIDANDRRSLVCERTTQHLCESSVPIGKFYKYLHIEIYVAMNFYFYIILIFNLHSAKAFRRQRKAIFFPGKN